MVICCVDVGVVCIGVEMQVLWFVLGCIVDFWCLFFVVWQWLYVFGDVGVCFFVGGQYCLEQFFVVGVGFFVDVGVYQCWRDGMYVYDQF